MEGVYLRGRGRVEFSTRVRRNSLNRAAISLLFYQEWLHYRRADTDLSSFVACLPKLSFRTSGRYHTESFRLKNNFAASLTILGNVTKPTQPHDAKNLILSQLVKNDGSILGPFE